MENLISNLDSIVVILLAVLGSLSIVARFTPTPKDDTIFSNLYDFISSLTPNDRVKKIDEVKEVVEDIVDDLKGKESDKND